MKDITTFKEIESLFSKLGNFKFGFLGKNWEKYDVIIITTPEKKYLYHILKNWNVFITSAEIKTKIKLKETLFKSLKKLGFKK